MGSRWSVPKDSHEQLDKELCPSGGGWQGPDHEAEEVCRVGSCFQPCHVPAEAMSA